MKSKFQVGKAKAKAPKIGREMLKAIKIETVE